MFVQTQLNTKPKGDILDILVKLQKLDRAWFKKEQPKLPNIENWQPFGNIECMLIQRYFNLYEASGFSQKY
jgi:hypothetical protein